MVFSTFLYRAFTAHVMVAMPSVLIGGIARGAGLQGAVIREGPTGDHQPLLGSDALALDPRLHPALDHRDGHWPFLAVSHRQMGPGRRIKPLAPIGYRLPGRFRPPSTPCVLGQRDLQV